METAYGSTGYRDEESWEQRRVADRIMIAEGLCNTGDVAFMRKDSETDEHRHDEQCRAKDRIDGPDNLIDREDRNGQVEDEYYNRPYQVGIGNIEHPLGQLIHQSGRNQHE